MLDATRSWYLVHSRPRQEEVAATHLERQGYRVVLPRLKLPRRRRDRWQDAIEPLFPRYLFVGLRVGEDEFRPVHSTRGVARVVRFGPAYTPVPAELIARLEAGVDEAGAHAFRSRELRSGDPVRIVAGPFRDFDAVFECASGSDRVRVLLSVLGCEARVTIDASLVVPALDGCVTTQAVRGAGLPRRVC